VTDYSATIVSIVKSVQTSSTASPRAEGALATRRRMVKAAYDLFCRDGYLGTTISAVAQEAGVAVPTVYYTFSTKAALFGESLGAAIVGFDLWRKPPPDPIDVAELLPWHAWWADFQAAATSAEALGIFITHGVGILQRVGPLIAAMHGASGQPLAAEVVRISEQRRVASYRQAIGVLARKPGGLRQALSVTEATDIVAVLFSAELYQALTVGRGWSHIRCLDFFQEILRAQLLADG
jgi:AcrR family transcriptional regulator